MKLLKELKILVQQERDLNVEILRKLREVEDTKLYARMGYKNMHAFCIEELGYSGPAADRRVKSMRLIRTQPQVEEKLANGEINLTTAADLQRTFVKAEIQRVDLPRAEIIAEVCGSTTREAEKVIKKRAAEAGLEINLEDEEFQNDLEWLLAHFSNAHPGLNKEGLLRMLVKEKVAKLDPKRERRGSGAGTTPDPQKRYVSAGLKREVIKRDEGRCTYISPAGKRCNATHFLEVDHVVPFARGGSTELSNLRLLCRTHNQLAAQDAGLLRPKSGVGTQRPLFH